MRKPLTNKIDAACSTSWILESKSIAIETIYQSTITHSLRLLFSLFSNVHLND